MTINAIPGGPTAGIGSISPVPEPSTWAMLMLAAMGWEFTGVATGNN